MAGDPSLTTDHSMAKEFQEFLPLFPIVALSIFVTIIGFISIILERRAARKEDREKLSKSR